jgi:hypothetical protein
MKLKWKGPGNITISSALFPPDSVVDFPDDAFADLDPDVKARLEPVADKPAAKSSKSDAAEPEARKPGRPRKVKAEE